MNTATVRPSARIFADRQDRAYILVAVGHYEGLQPNSHVLVNLETGARHTDPMPLADLMRSIRGWNELTNVSAEVRYNIREVGVTNTHPSTSDSVVLEVGGHRAEVSRNGVSVAGFNIPIAQARAVAAAIQSVS